MKYRKNNVLLLLEEKTDVYGDRVALGSRTALGWKEFTYKGLGLLSRKLGSYLINNLEVQKNDRVAILSESKPEYGACVFASILSGATTVPLDIKLTKFELVSILTDCQPKVLLVSQTYIEKALEIQKEVPSIKHVIVMDEPSYNMTLPSLYTIDSTPNCKWRHRSSKSTAFIIYTSGTTGNPKGVEISFRNMLAQLNALSTVVPEFIPAGENTKILPNSYIGNNAKIGANCFFHAGVNIGDRVVVGDHCILHHGVSLGADGFSFVTENPDNIEQARKDGEIKMENKEQKIFKIPSLGSVVIGNNVEIGANTTIDRGTIENTMIGDDTKIDDLVMIGHNCRIGKGCMIVSQVGIAGSCVIGDRVVIAGQAGLADHISIGSDSIVAAAAGVSKSFPEKSIVVGTPAVPRKEFIKQLKTMKDAGELIAKFKKYEPMLKTFLEDTEEN